MRRMLILALVLCLAPISARAEDATTPADAPKVWNGREQVKEVDAALAEYFGADAGRRAEIRTFLDDLGTIAPKAVKKHAKVLLRVLRKDGPKLTKKTKSFTYRGLTGRFFMQGKAKKGGALVIALHGGGEGVGDGANAMRKWGGPVGSKAITIAPTAPELRATAWNDADIEAWVLALADAAIRSWGLDPNKVYVCGHSMGGFGTWSIGCHHADRFAALAPCAGGVFTQRTAEGDFPVKGSVVNLLNTPIYFYHSTDDKQVGPRADQAANKALEALKEQGYPYEWVYDEYDDIGHGLPRRGLKPIVDWMFEHERDPFPKHVIWEAPGAQRRRADRMFWIGQTGSAWVEGQIDGNTVALTTKGPASGLTVFLHDELVDLEKPVTITVNGKTKFEGVVQPRLSVLLDTIATGRDPEQWYAHAVPLK